MKDWNLADILFDRVSEDILESLTERDHERCRAYREKIQGLRATLTPEQDGRLLEILRDKTELLLFFRPNDFLEGFRIGSGTAADLLAGTGELAATFEKILSLLREGNKKGEPVL